MCDTAAAIWALNSSPWTQAASSSLRSSPGQAVDALADQRLDIWRQRVPVDHAACGPAPVSILAERAALGQRVEHLDREQGVPFRMPVEGGAEGLVEAIGGAVEQAVDEAPAVSPIQVDQRGGRMAPQFMESLADELAMFVLFQGQRARAVRAGEEDVAPVQPLRQMVDEGNRAGVRPVQVVQRKQERRVACQAA